MGTQYSVKLVADLPLKSDEEAMLGQKIHKVLQRVDGAMSTYKAESDISRFNRWAPNEKFVPDNMTLEVLAKSQLVHDLSMGAFDITVGPLVDLWGFGAPSEIKLELPDHQDIARALELTGMSALEISNEYILKRKDIQLDLSAIAKGYAVDKVAEYLRSVGFEHFLVEVGGEISTSGKSSRNTKWVLGVEEPDFAGRKAYTRVFLSGQSLATSGDYRNYYELQGEKYSHTLDPRTGSPVSHQLASVSVVADSCALADAWATALMVFGEQEGFELAVKQDVNAYFIYRDANGGFASRHTPGFDQYLKE